MTAPTSLDLIQSPPPLSTSSGFPVLAVAILAISATAFLLVSYYIFITKCCFRWQQADPLSRFSIRPASSQVINEDPRPTSSYSPSWQSRGLNELLIREIPTFQYARRPRQGSADLSRCVVCLSEFQDNEMLRVLPKCSHAFHLDCIDVWLLSNSNCPLCRSTISGRNRYRVERIVAPNSSPQDPHPMMMMMAGSIVGGQDDFVVIEISGEDGSRQREGGASRSSRFLVHPRSCSSRKLDYKIGKSKPRKWNHFSIMGDEGIDIRETDEQFCIQPIRRSFSMDSAADRSVYLSAQEISRQNRHSEESSSRSRRSIFSFGHGRGSRNAVLPL